ncbi:NmrA family NAD(P)-binding protein [Mycobacterium sp. MYCO198283]|uniref:NmrA family NAD(P)-binding protein n=1 Tax=Mycobacterium sp. MYCO198283 TaxID=2883505 RepID=UPI001E2A65D1|nr:NmrA family NAD(P)-binding protein [Mycobacterium sp. MYCO198283]MCG5431540.1 NmrA family NAD(P)-binding protein [Mycobacterium sp. MYCO198283]
MLLITGPTGNVGAELVDLLARDHDGPWRIASRRPVSPADPATPPELVTFDFFDRTTWDAALDGVTSLFLLFPLPGNRAARQAIVPFVHAADRAGCRHVVYVSVFGAEKIPFIPHHAVEAALRASTMMTTILRCSFFMQNLHRRISTHGTDITERGELFIPAGRGRTTFLDARDAAAVAAQALLRRDGPRDAVHHLTGPAALSMTEVAEALTDALGYPVRYTAPSLWAFVRRLRRRGVGWDTIGFMSAVYTLTRLGRNQPITDEVQRLLGRPPRSLDAFLDDTAWRWRAAAWT